MKKLWAAMLVMLLTVSLGMSTAEARRLGGGGSFGKQSHSVTRQSRLPAQNQATRPSTPAATPATAPPAKPASPWRGILGGALLGLGLGALLSHFGLGGAMASMISTILMIALLAFAVMFIVRMFRRKSEPASPAAYAGGPSASFDRPSFDTPAIGSRIEPAQPSALQSSAPLASGEALDQAPWGIPAGFDSAGFLRQAKIYFIRLQAAWDKADINDLREFTTPEMYAEVKMQLQERGASPNNTDVVSLEADMLGIETIGNDYLASVRFHGMIKDSASAPAEPFTEVWNLSKPINGQGGWLLAGIQQEQ